ncbi:hypothetical protein [Nostoc sp.]|jgi:hypothetical protein
MAKIWAIAIAYLKFLSQRSYQRAALHGIMKPSHSLRFPLRKLARGKESEAYGGLFGDAPRLSPNHHLYK